MDWEFAVALILAIPIILLPVAFVWYLNLGGVISAIRAWWKKRAVRQKGSAADVKAQTEHITNTEH
jgi:hypothetical protein